MQYKTQKILLVLLMLSSLFGFATQLKADDSYTLLAPIPLTGADQPVTNQVSNFDSTYVNGVIALVIGLVGVLAVLGIIVGGFQYVTAATIGGKSGGRDTIMNALIGLGLAMASYIILYSLNPNLLNFDLTIKTLDATKPIDTNLSNQPPPPPPTCDPTKTTCPPPDNKPGWDAACTNCAPVPVTIPLKKPGACASTAPACEINQDLENKLVVVAQNMGSVGWQVTEAFPPADPNHVSTCHQNGSCVDAALTGGTPSAADVATFLSALQGAGLPSFLYEAPSCSRLKQLTSSPQLKSFASQIKVCKTTTAENVHINLSGGSGGSCGTASDGTSNEVSC